MTTIRKPTPSERGVARIVISLLGAAVVLWLLWGPWWMYHYPPPYDRELDAWIGLAAIPGCLVLLGLVFFLAVGFCGLAHQWLHWALTTPVAKPPETFEGIDEGRL